MKKIFVVLCLFVLIVTLGACGHYTASLIADQVQSTPEPLPEIEPIPTIEPMPIVEPEPTIEPVPMVEPEPTLEPESEAELSINEMTLEDAVYYAIAQTRAELKRIDIRHGDGYEEGRYDVHVKFYHPMFWSNITERNMMFSDIIVAMPYIQERILFSDDINWVQFYLYSWFTVGGFGGFGGDQERRQTVRIWFQREAIIAVPIWASPHVSARWDLRRISGDYWLHEAFMD